MQQWPAVHPKMIDFVGPLFDKVVTILEATTARTSSGAVINSGWSVVPGMEQIPAALGFGKQKQGEVRQADMTYDVSANSCVLAGAHKISAYWRAQIDDSVYDILNVWQIYNFTFIELQIVR